MVQLVQRLEDGPVDVVGDVHGERAALEALLEKLGYDERGGHPAGRRFVFVGDFCDRGPDSPGTLRLVRRLVESGRARAIAGNHELNLLRRERKHGNHWFFGVSEDPEFGDCASVREDEQVSILEYFRSLPLALEREDLRIVHAAWVDAAIDRCRGVELSIDAAYHDFNLALRSGPEFHALEARHDDEVRRLGASLKDEKIAPAARAIGSYDEFCQMGNPVRVITSGVERATERPFFAAGKWRFVERVPWWREYAGEVPVLFGHYWRRWDPSLHALLSTSEPDLFADDPMGPKMALRDRAFCIDFSVGSRWKQRQLGHEPPYQGRLAAMRWPERELVYDGEAPRPLGRGS